MRYDRLILSTVLLAGSVGLAATGDGLCQGTVPTDEVSQGPVPNQPAQVAATPQDTVTRTCAGCHSNRAKAGNLSLEGFQVEHAATDRETAEKMIRKVRAGQMPPPGARRPGPAVLAGLAKALETEMDKVEALPPGRRTFQRLNRAEYARSVHDLLALDIDAGTYLPLDPRSANFDNIADAQLLTPTLMQSYLTAAAEISRLAVGDARATAREVTFNVARWVSQREQVEGAPFGTRGGLAVEHTFPADGDYRFRVSFYYETTGALYGNGRAALHTAEAPEQVEISIDGSRVALLDIDRWMNSSDPDGLNLSTEPIRITAGPHRVAAAFIRRFEGPVQDLLSPLDWSIASTSIADAYGFTTLPHLRDMAITGPFSISGLSETPSRRAIFSCHPSTPAQQATCAHEIVTRLATQAFRRPVTERDASALMSLYWKGASEGGFEAGVRLAIEGILASPRFVFRFEERPGTTRADQSYAIGDFDLASRLSYFLWATAPDAPLRTLAASGRLSQPAVLEQQVARMLADPRAEVLATRFASQWLRLQDLDKLNPDVRYYPDFDEQLKDAMRRETELFFANLVRDDRPVLDLFTADYTFVNERLARHYRIPGVIGSQFQKVAYPDDRRRGLLGHGSVLTLTSHADRTSPVLRGKWVMEVMLGTPPPAPPPNVPDLDATPEAEDGRLRTVRERMEQHRANPACNSCHRMIDPIGLSLDNFDVTGAWRIRDNGTPVDAASTFYDGTPLGGPADLRRALLSRTDVLVQTFAENLMTYALGRRLDAADMPAVRALVGRAEAEEYRFSAFVRGVVRTAAFQRKGADDATPTAAPAGRGR
jgi:mono/diheme cytochrome c family protein